MSERIKSDLRYWGKKLQYAESTLWGEKREGMIKVCRAMIDLYLDRANEEKYVTIHSS